MNKQKSTSDKNWLPPPTEQGSVLMLFGFIILPFLFFVFSSGLDVSAYLREQENLRKFADDAVLRAWRFLPDQTTARTAVADVASEYGISSSDYAVSFKDGDMTIQAAKTFQLWLAKYFDKDLALPLRAFAVGTGTPFDLAILFDVSRYMAPPIQAPWDSVKNWNPALFFRDNNDKLFPTAVLGTSVGALDRTLQCFNPILAALKTAAIRSYENMGSFARNAISVGIFPSSAFEVEFLRPLEKGGVLPVVDDQVNGAEAGEALFLQQNSSEVNFSSWCAAAAAQEQAEDLYKVPSIQNPLFTAPSSTEQIVQLVSPYKYNLDYSPQLSLAESVWSATVSERLQNTAQVIESGVTNLFDATSVNRRGLSGREVKTLVVLSGGFPRDANGIESDDALVNAVAAEAQQIRSIQNADLRIFYVIVYSEDILGSLSSAEQRFSILEQKVNAALESAVSSDPSANLQARYSFKALLAKNNDEALRSLMGQLMLVRKNSLLSE